MYRIVQYKFRIGTSRFLQSSSVCGVNKIDCVWKHVATSSCFRGFTKSVIKFAEYNVTASDINFDLWLILGYRFRKFLAFNFNDLMNMCDVFGVGDSILFILQRNLKGEPKVY